MATRKNRRPKRTSTDRYGRKVLKMLKEAPALMSPDEIQESERHYLSDADGVARRAALAILTRSGAELLETVKDRQHALALAAFDEFISEYRQRVEALATLIKTAEMRVLTALATRDDMHQLMAEAKRVHGAGKEAATH